MMSRDLRAFSFQKRLPSEFGTLPVLVPTTLLQTVRLVLGLLSVLHLLQVLPQA